MAPRKDAGLQNKALEKVMGMTTEKPFEKLGLLTLRRPPPCHPPAEYIPRLPMGT